jgi:hypothetical protein
MDSPLKDQADVGLLIANQQLITQLIDAHGERSVINTLARLSGYEHIPPSMREFVTNTDYLGSSVGLFSIERGGGLYPEWEKVLKQIFPNQFYSPYTEVLLSGSIGTGKTTAALVGVLYDLCKILCLAKPHKRWLLLPSTIIAFAIFNATLQLVEDVLSSQFNEWVSESPFFKSLLTNVKKSTLFKNNIDVVYGSRFGQSLGRAIIGCILDEANFQDKVMNQAYNNYSSIKTRIESRFMKLGQVPAHMYLVSSKSDETGWLQSHIDTVRTLPTSFVFEPAIWDVLYCKNIYSGKSFKLFVGDRLRDPFIVERPDQIIGIDEALVIDVPIEYYERFKVDLYRSLQDLAGRGTFSSMNFLTSAELIEECQIRENPCSKVIIPLDFFDKNDKLINYLLFDRIYLDSRPRFLHIDLGLKTDKTGIAATRFEGMVTVKRFDPFTGKIHTIREPIFHTDFILCVECRPGQEVPIYKVKDLVIDLRSRGYPVARVSADGYQSANLLQDLKLVGFETDELSVDRKKDPYYYLKNTILESRYSGVKHPIFDKEVRNLIDDKKKIDHPPKFPDGSNGSKDITDAVCGSVYNAFTHQDMYLNIIGFDEYAKAIEKYAEEDLGIYGEIMKHASFVGDLYQ